MKNKPASVAVIKNFDILSLFSCVGQVAPTAGEVIFDGEDLLEMEADERSRAGLFLAFQYPASVPGVTLAKFLRQTINSRRQADDPEDKGISIPLFRRFLKEKMDMLGIDIKFAGRYLNEGFSGGEKESNLLIEKSIGIFDQFAENKFGWGERRGKWCF